MLSEMLQQSVDPVIAETQRELMQRAHRVLHRRKMWALELFQKCAAKYVGGYFHRIQQQLMLFKIKSGALMCTFMMRKRRKMVALGLIKWREGMRRKLVDEIRGQSFAVLGESTVVQQKIKLLDSVIGMESFRWQGVQERSL